MRRDDDLTGDCVYQDAREVKTKFRKTFTTYFFPVGDEIRDIVVDWLTYLRQTKLWGNDDPLFPATEMVVGANRRFEVAGLKRQHWSGAAPIRAIFRRVERASGVDDKVQIGAATVNLAGHTLVHRPHMVQASVSSGALLFLTSLACSGSIAREYIFSQSRSLLALPIARSCSLALSGYFTISPTWAAILEVLTPVMTSSRFGRARCSAGVT